MRQTSARLRATQLKSRSTVPLFPTAICTLTAGCLLLGIIALVHEESPVARLIAERSPQELGGPSAPGAPFGSALVAAPDTSRPDSPSRDSVARLVGSSSPFRNASQSTSGSSRGPAVQLGPLVAAGDRVSAGVTRDPIAEASNDPTKLVTRTYRLTSMSAVGLERLVRPLLTARGEAVASSADSPRQTSIKPPIDAPGANSDLAMAEPPDVLVVSDRPEAIGRVDALCHDLESTSPRIAIDLAVVSVLPTTGRTLPWAQWRDSFGIIDSELPAALTQIRGLGRTIQRASSQLQVVSGAWAELECTAQSGTHASGPGDLLDAAIREAPATTLHLRPSRQSDGAIRIEVRAQSSRLEDHAPAEHPQLVTVRFNTEIVLREGATGVVNLFVDQPLDAPLVAPGGLAIPGTKILPQPGKQEQTLLLLMPRIAGAPNAPGKIAASPARDPA